MSIKPAEPQSLSLPVRARLSVLQPPPEPPARFNVRGVGIDALSFEDAVERLMAAPRQGRKLRVHFAALHTLVEASKDSVLRESLADADIVTPDGMPLVWLGRIKGARAQRVCGPDTMLAVLDESREHGYRHFFYGGTPEVVDALAQSMRQRFPGLQIAGVYSPPFRDLDFEEAEASVRLINDAYADYVWVGLGSPKQDQWLAAFRPLLNAPVLLGVGAAFDFHSGYRRRAPRWAQRLGFEWLFRLASEPRRLAARYVMGGGRFLQYVITDAIWQRGFRT